MRMCLSIPEAGQAAQDSKTLGVEKVAYQRGLRVHRAGHLAVFRHSDYNHTEK